MATDTAFSSDQLMPSIVQNLAALAAPDDTDLMVAAEAIISDFQMLPQADVEVLPVSVGSFLFNAMELLVKAGARWDEEAQPEYQRVSSDAVRVVGDDVVLRVTERRGNQVEVTWFQKPVETGQSATIDPDSATAEPSDAQE